MRQRRLATAAGAVLGSLLALALASARSSAQTGGELREEFHQTYALTADGRVSLRNINGPVQITGWERNEVKVDAVKTARTRERLDEARIVVDATPNSIDIHTQYADRNLTFHDDDANNPASVEYKLSVPRGARLDEVKLVNGPLQIEGVNGEIEVSSVNGRVSIKGVGGRADVSTVNGRLEAEFQKLASDVKLKSVNGSVTAIIPSDSSVELKADTVHGGISTDFDIPVQGGMVGHRLNARLGAGENRLNLKNVNGRIEIRRAHDGKPQSAVTNLLPERRARFD